MEKNIKKDEKYQRDNKIIFTSMLGIVMNVVLALIKILLGLFTKSMAIVSEGINNATDVLSSILALAGNRLAKLHPDKEHPFGYGRVEYLASLIISIIILFTGMETLINSIKSIFNREELQVSYVTLIIIAGTAIIKFIYGTYAIKVGKEVDSGSLEGVGIDSRNDCLLSVVTIVSAIVFLMFHISIDVYASIFISIMIIKAGLEIFLDTVQELIGRPGEEELAKKLYKEIRDVNCILNAADMMLHNYGPNQYSGSVNIEIDHDKKVGDVYQTIHELQLKIMHNYNVTMVFGIYAVDNDHEDCKKVRQVVADFIKDKEHVKNFHAVYLEPDTNKIYCDLVVDYDLKSWTPLKEEFLDYMKGYYPKSPIELTIETEFV